MVEKNDVSNVKIKFDILLFHFNHFPYFLAIVVESLKVDN